jgi:hypothetical protein
MRSSLTPLAIHVMHYLLNTGTASASQLKARPAECITSAS